MKIDAKPETVRAVAEAFKLAGVLDDRVAHPDRARVIAWAEQIERHKLTEPDLLDGLQAFYDSPSERAMQIGDLIHHARQVRRDRNQREADAELERRREVHDVKAADEVRALTAGIGGGPTRNRTERLVRAELGLQCAIGRTQAMAAMREWTEAKTEARKGKP